MESRRFLKAMMFRRRPQPHRRDDLTGLSLGTVASPQSRPAFRPADQFSASVEDSRARIRRLDLPCLIIPPNTKVTVHLPTRTKEATTESGRPVERVHEVRFLRIEGNQAVMSVGSGTYSLFALGR